MKSVLIANRGEIAVRVIRTLRVMGIKSILVASDCDQSSVAAKLADVVMPLPGNTASETYLDIEKVVRAAVDSHADAIHPGYGFLSERHEFVQALEEAKVGFIGPSASSMQLLGSKVEAKKLAQALGVPLVPGYFEPGATCEDLKKATTKIGYPVLLKASAGGGGRGMRQVNSESEFDQAFALARDEAVRSFGDGALMVEKLVEKPRHIELQMVADKFGASVALFERECSLQRKRQKVMEEAGAVLANYGEDLWQPMRECAIKLIQAAKYEGAATAEFLVDEKTRKFYFLEVNARLQVEHPVTELITGLDLVRTQIEICRGKKLELRSELMSGNRTALTGHAIEARITAESPKDGFLPSVGKISAFAMPSGPGVRVDCGFQKGDEVTRHYDSLIAKLICFGSNRNEAIDRLRSALKDTHILGVKTNVSYLLDILDHPSFQSGHFDVNWLESTFNNWEPKVSIPDSLEGFCASSQGSGEVSTGVGSRVQFPVWESIAGFRN